MQIIGYVFAIVIVVLFLLFRFFLSVASFIFSCAAAKINNKASSLYQAFANETGMQFIGKTSLSNLRGAEHFHLFAGCTKNSFSEIGTINLGNYQ